MNNQDKVLEAAMAAEFRSFPEQWFYVSFTGPGYSMGSVFVRAHGQHTAIYTTLMVGAYPGGEALVVALGEDKQVPEMKYCYRLLSTRELHGLFPGQMVDESGKSIKWEN